jgi:hypothetical protein
LHELGRLCFWNFTHVYREFERMLFELVVRRDLSSQDVGLSDYSICKNTILFVVVSLTGSRVLLKNCTMEGFAFLKFFFTADASQD